ncbi:MAG TPA: M1 family metallopeptidase [Salinimicrobium sp.]|nr:M1 family metallopeptidase [Salinimicrobium sp.]
MKKHILPLLLLFFVFGAQAQILSNKQNNYTRADTLRGSLRPERTNFDVLKYDLSVKVNPEKRFISGMNEITFSVLKELPVMQIDLFENMKVDSILYKGKQLNFKREYNAVFISFENPLQPNNKEKIEFYYSGNPVVAKNAPWDGGFIFTKDKNGKPWVSVAVQGTGASLWYPNKDHQSDEPEEAEIHVAAPNGLMNVSNGRLTGKMDLGNGYTEWSWKVQNPINNYNIILNIGDYVHFSDKYQDLDLDYYVLSYNLEKAKKQFEQVQPMMACFYEKFGPYPFAEDSFKLVETPFLGMEHQSAVAYGNHYLNGYLGNDMSGTGIGMLWDYIIIHESAHEWFGNSITASDIADMWIHESFTAYAESVFVECEWGKEKALDYLYGLRRTIGNRTPIIGDYDVNSEGSGDMYFKGANMLNTIRSVVNNDEKWWNIIKEFSLTFKHKIIDTKTVVDFFEEKTGLELSAVFHQYLKCTSIPELQFSNKNGKVLYRWEAEAPDFKMPIDVFVDGKEQRISPSEEWRELKSVQSTDEVTVDLKGFYVKVNKSK